eukprot:gb/GFBE01032447.1/.p1 GENE.gb/GFBE01032447.1/~~gb/GFBE01032447.1/.p1  ORF type:complete len:147 (+),score=37.13 gb/GFBE01032447.1/:1-441(+)
MVRSRGLLLPGAILAACAASQLLFVGPVRLPAATRVARAAAMVAAADVTPLGNQVLVEEIEEEAEDTGGLLLSEGSKKKTRLRLGRVHALGKGTSGDMREPKLLEDLKEGDTVLWEDFANRKLEDSAENKLFLVPIRSVKAKVSSR